MNTQNNWEKEVVSALLSEQRKSRLSGWIFKSFIILYILVSTAVGIRAFNSFSEPVTSDGVKHTALIELSGIIMDKAPAGADHIISALRRAMYDPDTAGIIIRCNSPGGSPVQSDNIYREIRRLRSSNPGTPIHTVVTDVCASGGYYVASATDKIFVNPSSILGSIGVINAGFGYTELMEKLGVERRVLTAGKHKAMLDAFMETTPEGENHTKKIMASIHHEFIKSVKRGRGKRLKKDDTMFSGLYWPGRKSISLGLADGIGDIWTVSSNIIGVNNMVNFTTQESSMSQFMRKLTNETKIMFKELSSYVISL